MGEPTHTSTVVAAVMTPPLWLLPHESCCTRSAMSVYHCSALHTVLDPMVANASKARTPLDSKGAIVRVRARHDTSGIFRRPSHKQRAEHVGSCSPEGVPDLLPASLVEQSCSFIHAQRVPSFIGTGSHAAREQRLLRIVLQQHIAPGQHGCAWGQASMTVDAKAVCRDICEGLPLSGYLVRTVLHKHIMHVAHACSVQSVRVWS